MRKRTRRIAAAVFAFSLVAAACGDDGGDDGTEERFRPVGRLGDFQKRLG